MKWEPKRAMNILETRILYLSRGSVNSREILNKLILILDGPKNSCCLSIE